MPFRLEQSLIASTTIAVGFTVGCIASSSAPLQRVDTRVGPEIRAIPASLTEAEIIEVSRSAVLVDEDQFVLGPVKCPHPAIVLGPYAQVFEFGIDLAARGHHLFDMTPIHADIMNRAVMDELARLPSTVVRNATNSSFVISPDAIANSRCLTLPSPET